MNDNKYTESENKDLKDIVYDRIRKKGRITFAEYMDLVLYHPIQGYYNSPKEIFGKDGDYYTSPYIHPVFGHLIAGLIHKMWNALDKRQDFTIVEAGAGKGFLCCDILNRMREKFPDFYESSVYKIIEINRQNIVSQKELLKRHAHEYKVRWHCSDDLKDGRVQFNGCYISNELIDSFPFNRVKMVEGKLSESYVILNRNRLNEELGGLSTNRLAQYFENLDITLKEGQRAEVNLRVFDWMEEINRAMEQGFIITIDYGYKADELFAPFRKDGTLTCYYRHTVNHDPYIRVGLQDITAHVDFSTLMATGEKMGLKITAYLEQYRFLIALGLLSVLDEIEKNRQTMSTAQYYKEKLSMKNFLVPGGMGVLFKVLIQFKGVEDNRGSVLRVKKMELKDNLTLFY
ncbi:MAG: SAM-dependent methyltransferase [Thermodesulfobacteriota bacterium]|nr:SAM-dependent methyltransferase [Thermodesulfobacteriota bacterium]